MWGLLLNKTFALLWITEYDFPFDPEIVRDWIQLQKQTTRREGVTVNDRCKFCYFE